MKSETPLLVGFSGKQRLRVRVQETPWGVTLWMMRQQEQAAAGKAFRWPSWPDIWAERQGRASDNSLAWRGPRPASGKLQGKDSLEMGALVLLLGVAEEVSGHGWKAGA